MNLLKLAAVAMAVGLGPATANAQNVSGTQVEAAGGWAGFVDDSLINHKVAGGAARFYLTPRLAIGPEITYMKGPGSDRDLFLTGNVTFDALRGSLGKPARVTPYFVAGGGFLQHSDNFGAPGMQTTFTSYEGAFTAGGGVRAFITDALFIGSEVRLGWEPHLRANVTVGVRIK